MKILKVITSLKKAGTEKNFFNTAVELKKRGHQIEVCCLKNEDYYSKKLSQKGIPVLHLHLPEKIIFFYPPLFIFAAMRLCIKAITGNYDILHAYLFQANLITRFAGFFSFTPNISSIRTSERERKISIFIDRYTSFLVSFYTAVSNSVLNFSIQNLKISRKKIQVISGATIPQKGRPQDDTLKKKLKLPEDAIILSTIGRLVPLKNFNLCIEAIHRLRSKFPEIKLFIIGEGTEEKRLKKLCEKYQLQNAIIFTGFLENVEPILAVSDIFLLLSRGEGMPNVILEALQAGTPIIGACVEGITDIIKNNQNGLLCEPENITSICNAIEKLIQSPELRERLKENGKKTIKKNFSLKELIDKTESLYKKLSKKNIL